MARPFRREEPKPDPAEVEAREAEEAAEKERLEAERAEQERIAAEEAQLEEARAEAQRQHDERETEARQDEANRAAYAALSNDADTRTEQEKASAIAVEYGVPFVDAPGAVAVEDNDGE